MFRLIGRAAVIFALCVSIGAHWAVLQSVAWATMIIDYSQRVSLATAVAQTFDGEHPCGLCKHISSAKHSEKKQDTAQVTIKPDLICATRAIVLIPPYKDLSFARVKMSASADVHSPPVPPPRSELV